MSISQKIKDAIPGLHSEDAARGEVDRHTPGAFPTDDMLPKDQQESSSTTEPSRGKAGFGGTTTDTTHGTGHEHNKLHKPGDPRGTTTGPGHKPTDSGVGMMELERERPLTTSQATDGGTYTSHNAGKDSIPGPESVASKPSQTGAEHNRRDAAMPLGAGPRDTNDPEAVQTTDTDETKETKSTSNATRSGIAGSGSTTTHKDPYWGDIPRGAGVYNTVTGHGSQEDEDTRHKAIHSGENASPTSATSGATGTTGIESQHRAFPLTSIDKAGLRTDELDTTKGSPTAQPHDSRFKEGLTGAGVGAGAGAAAYALAKDREEGKARKSTEESEDNRDKGGKLAGIFSRHSKDDKHDTTETRKEHHHHHHDKAAQPQTAAATTQATQERSGQHQTTAAGPAIAGYDELGRSPAKQYEDEGRAGHGPMYAAAGAAGVGGAALATREARKSDEERRRESAGSSKDEEHKDKKDSKLFGIFHRSHKDKSDKSSRSPSPKDKEGKHKKHKDTGAAAAAAVPERQQREPSSATAAPLAMRQREEHDPSSRKPVIQESSAATTYDDHHYGRDAAAGAGLAGAGAAGAYAYHQHREKNEPSKSRTPASGSQEPSSIYGATASRAAHPSDQTASPARNDGYKHLSGTGTASGMNPDVSHSTNMPASTATTGSNTLNTGPSTSSVMDPSTGATRGAGENHHRGAAAAAGAGVAGAGTAAYLASKDRHDNEKTSPATSSQPTTGLGSSMEPAATGTGGTHPKPLAVPTTGNHPTTAAGPAVTMAATSTNTRQPAVGSTEHTRTSQDGQYNVMGSGTPSGVNLGDHHSSTAATAATGHSASSSTTSQPAAASAGSPATTARQQEAHHHGTKAAAGGAAAVALGAGAYGATRDRVQDKDTSLATKTSEASPLAKETPVEKQQARQAVEPTGTQRHEGDQHNKGMAMAAAQQAFVPGSGGPAPGSRVVHKCIACGADNDISGYFKSGQ